MIFLRYESFRQYIRMYRVTTVLLALNLLLFALALFSPFGDYIMGYGSLIHGAPYHLDLWRYVTSIFLHGGFDHLLFNCFAIFVFAPPLEYLLGRARYALLFLGSGVIGNLISMIINNNSYTASVGASGAIYGIYGAYLFLIAFRRHALDPSSRKTVQIFVVMGIIYSFLIPEVNWAAHIGGLLGGVLIFSRIVTGLRRH
jgi:membrane associated rhomboid family serine protease